MELTKTTVVPNGVRVKPVPNKQGKKQALLFDRIPHRNGLGSQKTFRLRLILGTQVREKVDWSGRLPVGGAESTVGRLTNWKQMYIIEG